MNLVKIVLLLVSAALCAAIPGGWTKADASSDEVKAEASFAVQTQFPGTTADFVTVEAFKQVVAGLKYDLKVEVKTTGCNVYRFQVWDRFGTKTLADSNKVDELCSILK